MAVPIPSADALIGLNNLLFHYAKVRAGDAAIVAYWRECPVAAAWLFAALEAADVEARLVRLDSLEDQEIVEKLPALLDVFAGRRLHLFVGENESLSFTAPLRAVAQRAGVAIWRLMNFTPGLFELGLALSPDELRRINAGLLHRLMPARAIEILSDAGTALTATLDSVRFQWISNFGQPAAGELIALPAGEVNTYPARLDGRYVADGALHANVPLPFDVRLAERPVTLDIVDGEVVAFSCCDANLSRGLETMFSHPLCRRIGELGFGTNRGVKTFTRENTHINERFPAVHLGLGEHTQPGRVDYEAPMHMDMISRRTVVRVLDGGPDIAMWALTPDDRPHPAGTRAEDIEHVPA